MTEHKARRSIRKARKGRVHKQGFLCCANYNGLDFLTINGKVIIGQIERGNWDTKERINHQEIVAGSLSPEMEEKATTLYISSQEK